MLKFVSFLFGKSFERQDYWGTGQSNPSPKDASQDYELIRAMEVGGKTYVDFYRNATTGDHQDIQFMVKINFLITPKTTLETALTSRGEPG